MFYKIILITSIILFGLSSGIIIRVFKERLNYSIVYINTTTTEVINQNGIGAESNETFSYNYRNIKPLLWDIKDSLILQKKDFIEADLSDMRLKVYQKGEFFKEYPILVKGEEGKWGETPAGLFKIRLRQRNHFSSLGQVYMPWNMVFQGNYSIHGWPYYPDGTLTSRSFSSGCINLSTEDAEELFDIAEIGMPVLVLKKDFQNDGFIYNIPIEASKPPELTAKSYLAADLKNGFVFLEENPDLNLPIASVTKLMTALVSSEYSLLSFNQEMMSLIRITPEMVAPIGEIPDIKVGKRFSHFALFYPLLMSSSNDAAEALAISQNKNSFIKLMNERAQSLEMNATNFVDAYGYDEGNVSTVEDLFYLAKYLFNNRRWILDITKGEIFNNFGPISFRELKNLNLFYNEDEFIGGKVGSTPTAKKTGVFIFNLEVKDEQKPIAIILLGSEDNKKDVELILSWIKSNFTAPLY